MFFYQVSLFSGPYFLISDTSLSILMKSGDLVKMATVNIESRLPPGQRFERLSRSLSGLLPYLSVRSAFQLIFPLFFVFFCVL